MLSFWIKFLGTPNDLEEAVAARMERQRVIYRGGKRFVAVLEEQALHTWFGTAETQAGQLDRLLALMSLPNVSLDIVPMMTERAAVGSTGFWIFDDNLVALETPTASIEVNRPQECELRPHVRGSQSPGRVRASRSTTYHPGLGRAGLTQRVDGSPSFPTLHLSPPSATNRRNISQLPSTAAQRSRSVTTHDDHCPGTNSARPGVPIFARDNTMRLPSAGPYPLIRVASC